jgi:FkbM family methyltransferase
MKTTLAGLERYYRAFGYYGLYLAFKSKLSSGAPEVSVTPPGIGSSVALRLKSSDVATYLEAFVDADYDFECHRPPKTILDAGAHIGLVSVLFANRWPDAQIIALEPEPANFALLKKNTARYKMIIPVQAALSSDNGLVSLVDPGLGSAGFRIQNTESNAAKGASHSIPGVTVDRLMEAHGIDQVDILKMDIEGAEKDVLDASSKWMSSVALLIVELHDRYRNGCQASFYRATAGFNSRSHHHGDVFLAERRE